jgi:hypothetical protein
MNSASVAFIYMSSATCQPFAACVSCHLSTCFSFLSPVCLLLFPVTSPHAALSCHLSACCSFLSPVHMLLFPVPCPHAALSCHLSVCCSFLPPVHMLLFPVTYPQTALSCHLSACYSFLSPVWLLVRPERLGGRRGCCARALNAASRCRAWRGPPRAHTQPQFFVTILSLC